MRDEHSVGCTDIFRNCEGEDLTLRLAHDDVAVHRPVFRSEDQSGGVCALARPHCAMWAAVTAASAG